MKEEPSLKFNILLKPLYQTTFILGGALLLSAGIIFLPKIGKSLKDEVVDSNEDVVIAENAELSDDVGDLEVVEVTEEVENTEVEETPSRETAVVPTTIQQQDSPSQTEIEEPSVEPTIEENEICNIKDYDFYLNLYNEGLEEQNLKFWALKGMYDDIQSYYSEFKATPALDMRDGLDTQWCTGVFSCVEGTLESEVRKLRTSDYYTEEEIESYVIESYITHKEMTYDSFDFWLSAVYEDFLEAGDDREELERIKFEKLDRCVEISYEEAQFLKGYNSYVGDVTVFLKTFSPEY